MGLVRFYACEGDPLRVALKLVLKAREQNQAVEVCGEAAQLERLSALLWGEPGFLPHAGPAAPDAVRRRSPIGLNTTPDGRSAPVLINMGNALDCSSAPAERVFELVGPGESERQAGRQRFRRHEQVRGQRPEHVKVPA